LLEEGETIEDAIYKMTGNGDVATKAKTINTNYTLNNYNSAIKGSLDNWYKKNLISYTSYLDQTSVYCNNRSISDLGGWNPTGTSINGDASYLKFYQYNINRNLNCFNETDRFAVTNNKAKLTYPIGLLMESERSLMTYVALRNSSFSWWGMTPYYFGIQIANVYGVSGNGEESGSGTSYVYGRKEVRPVITLKPGALFESGDGTYTDPYIVGPIVDLNS
jgi:hypothetical protein